MPRKTKEEVLEEYRCASIQDAAMAVIARKGIDDSTVQDIADEAGIAKGTVYLYFRDREDLLAKTGDRLFENLLTEVTPAFDAQAPFADKLRALVLRQIRFFEEHKALFRATMALSQREAESHRPKTRCFGQYMARLQRLFVEAEKSGELREGLDGQVVADVFRDCIRGVILRRLDPKQKTKQSVESDADFIVSLLLRGIHSGERR